MSLSNNLTESKIACPHCWHSFYPDEAWFISRHQSLYGDAVLGDNENRRFAPHEIQRDRAGQALDSMGWVMNERACPLCHLQIPPDLLSKRPFFISVAGAPASGKTYFLTSMIHELRAELARSFGFSLRDSDSHEVQNFLDYEQALFYAKDANQPARLEKTQEYGKLCNVVRLDGADVQLPKPFIFSLRPSETHPGFAKRGSQLNQSLVMYDNSGESYRVRGDHSAQNRVTQHLKECNAVLFAFDPLQNPETRMRLQAVSNDPQLRGQAQNYRQETILAEIINRMRRYRQMQNQVHLPVDLVVCVQKYDVWKSLIPYAESKDGEHLIDHSSIEFIKEKGIAGLDVEEINRISLLVRGFLQDLCPEFVALAETHFRAVRYFPVSALGTSPEPQPDNLLSVRPIYLQPFRVTHPMLWLLRRWSLIYRTVRPRRNNPYPQAKVTLTAEGKLRVVSPVSGQPFILDTEYSESAVIDPSNGEWFWIPKTVTSSTTGQSNPMYPPTAVPPPPPAAKANNSSSLGLTLGEPTKPPKKGWFRG